MPTDAMLEARSLAKLFPGRGWRGKPFRAVESVSFSVRQGEALGIVGESGSGKTTVGRMVSMLLQPTSGSLRFDGMELSSITPDAFIRHPLRRQVQHVFQDVSENLTPHFTAFDAIADPLRRLLGLRDVRARVEEMAASVSLPVELLSRYPHQLSGGQRSRVGIARALAASPRLVVLDEPTASLDVSVQAGVLRTLHELREKLGLAMIFISHDIEVVRLVCSEVLVMRHGAVVESGPVQDVLGSPREDYTRELIASVPRMRR